MNMQSLMAQAQKMQKEITIAKTEIDSQIFTGESQLVKVTMNGKKIVQSIHIDKNISIKPDDIDVLEDMILIATNNCVKEIDKTIDAKLGKYGQSLNGLI